MPSACAYLEVVLEIGEVRIVPYMKIVGSLLQDVPGAVPKHFGLSRETFIIF